MGDKGKEREIDVEKYINVYIYYTYVYISFLIFYD